MAKKQKSKRMAGNGKYRTDIDCGAGAMNCCRRVDPWVLALWVLALWVLALWVLALWVFVVY